MGCLRGGLGVVVGFGAYIVFTFIVFTGAYLALGTDSAFEEGSFTTSMVWNVIGLVVALVSTLIGAWICTKIAPSKGAHMTMIILIIVFGAIGVVGTTMAPDPGPRDSDLGNMEAMFQAVQPMWSLVANVVLGVIGAWLGGKGNVRSNPA